MSHCGLIIFDGDDTLWKTQELYDAAKRHFVTLLRAQGFFEPNIINILDEIDVRQVKSKGFVIDRFQDSMIKTYVFLCELEQRQSNQEINVAIKSICTPLLGSHQLYKDAINVLQSLSFHYSLVLATKGDILAQKEKINQLGVHQFFKQIYILAQKTELEYSQIIDDQRIRKDNVWVVGNSVKSDINPALRLGLRAILISRGSWLYEEDLLLCGDVARVDSLTEAAHIIFTRDLKRPTL